MLTAAFIVIHICRRNVYCVCMCASGIENYSSRQERQIREQDQHGRVPYSMKYSSTESDSGVFCVVCVLVRHGSSVSFLMGRSIVVRICSVPCPKGVLLVSHLNETRALCMYKRPNLFNNRIVNALSNANAQSKQGASTPSTA